jgi:hypothetical protein
MRRTFAFTATTPGRLAHLGFAAAIVLAGCRDPQSRDAAVRPADGVLLGAAPQDRAASRGSTRLAAVEGVRPALLIGPTTIWLDSTMIGDVVAALGPAAIAGDRSDRGIERVLSACYIAGVGAEMTTILLTAQGYLSDADSAVREDTVNFDQSMKLVPVWKVAIARVDTDSGGLTACLPMASPPSAIHFGEGLRLGSTRDEVERQVGPGWVDDGDGVRVHDRRSNTGRGAGTGYLRITVRYVAGAAAMIETRYMSSFSDAASKLYGGGA